MTDAVEENFTQLLRKLLDQRNMSIRALARAVPVNAGQLSRVLNNKRSPTPELARRCDAVLEADGQLVRAAIRHREEALTLANALEPGRDSTPHLLPDRRGTLVDGTLRLGADAITYYEVLLAAHVRADNILGPRPVLDVVRQESAALLRSVRAARGGERSEAVRLGCRYEEFLGWLHQDAGRLGLAAAHTDRARDLATELDDPRLTAYLLMRKSTIVGEAGDPALSLALADAAVSRNPRRSGRLHAVILRQLAQAAAALGEVTACSAAIDVALESAAGDESEADELAGYCTTSFVAMEAAMSWLVLGRPAEALAAFERAPDDWASDRRRDHGLQLARRASAHAAAEDPDTACDLARLALRTVRETGSARTVKQLRSLAAHLATWRHRADVVAVLCALDTLNEGET